MLKLKPKSWRVMGMTTFGGMYWGSWVERSLESIVNSTVGNRGTDKT